MSEMKKIYITGLWILCLTSGVSAQTYDIIERRNSWNAGANVTGIMMDSISASYAELYGKNNHGDFRNYYEAKEAWSAGAVAKSITHLKGYSLTGSFSFDHTSGKDMSGSMFIHPGFYPVDLLEFTHLGSNAPKVPASTRITWVSSLPIRKIFFAPCLQVCVQTPSMVTSCPARFSAETGKEYLSFYFMEANSYEVE